MDAWINGTSRITYKPISYEFYWISNEIINEFNLLNVK
jgi:hypothetical protein